MLDIIKPEAMSKKSPYIAEIIKDCRGSYNPHYLGYFKCFGQQLYYEAHDVLEELWLRDKKSPNYAYYKGLIQAAGAFVHLKLQHEFPDHPVHGQRLHPAARLFVLARGNLEGYAPKHMGFWVDEFILMLDSYSYRLAHSNFRQNPYDPANPPPITMPEDKGLL
ncbi:DUF309 domain-containing protein [Oscillatoria amoena NRMC-F 0135]|nr:DUF309 domain-containing protein [Oscillatoria amoena NRMC-F 0135]